jgi:hypothetical protein
MISTFPLSLSSMTMELYMLLCSLGHTSQFKEECVRLVEGVKTDELEVVSSLDSVGRVIDILPVRKVTAPYQRFRIEGGPTVELELTPDKTLVTAMVISGEFLSTSVVNCSLQKVIEDHQRLLTICGRILEFLVALDGSEKFYARVDWHVPVVLTCAGEDGSEEVAERVSLPWLVAYLQNVCDSKGIMGVASSWLTKVPAEMVPLGATDDAERAAVLLPALTGG